MMQVSGRVLNPLTLRDEFAAVGVEYQALGVVDGVLTGYLPDGTTEPVADSDDLARVLAAHDPKPLWVRGPSVEERLAAVEAAALDLMLGGVAGV
jgi:hypothetical protein